MSGYIFAFLCILNDKSKLQDKSKCSFSSASFIYYFIIFLESDYISNITDRLAALHCNLMTSNFHRVHEIIAKQPGL